MSETTEGRGDYFGAAPKLDLYGGSMNSLAPGSLPSEWSSTKQGFNGMCTMHIAYMQRIDEAQLYRLS